MNVVVLAVELNETYPEVRTHLIHRCFADIEQIVVEHSSSVLGHKDQVSIQGRDYTSTTTKITVIGVVVI